MRSTKTAYQSHDSLQQSNVDFEQLDRDSSDHRLKVEESCTLAIVTEFLCRRSRRTHSSHSSQTFRRQLLLKRQPMKYASVYDRSKTDDFVRNFIPSIIDKRNDSKLVYS